MYLHSSLVLLGSLPAALMAPLSKPPERDDTTLALGAMTGRDSASAKRQLAGIPIVGELAPEILAFITRGLGEGLIPRDTTVAKRQLEGLPVVGELAPEILALITGALGGGLLPRDALNPAAVIGAAVSTLTDPFPSVFGGKTGAGGGSNIPAFLQELGNGELNKRSPAVQNDQLNPASVVGAVISALSDPLAKGFGGKTDAGGGSNIPDFVQELGNEGLNRRDSNFEARQAELVGLLGPVASSLLPLGGLAGPLSNTLGGVEGAGTGGGLTGALVEPLKVVESPNTGVPLSLVDGVTNGIILPRAADSKGDDVLLTIVGALVAAATDPVAPLFGGVEGAGGPSNPLDSLKLLGMLLGSS